MKQDTYEFDVQDVEYLRHGDEALLATIYTPKGDGPFPAVIELHGGAWTKFDRTRGKAVHEALARTGIVVVALDFRQGSTGAYPKSPTDINYGIRWLKANAARFKVDPQRVGISGNSSGGHLGMLVAMRAKDAHYSSIPLPAGSPNVDASVKFVSMLWPVINPIGRYRYAQSLIARGNAPDWASSVITMHDAYWGSVEAMSEGSPTMILERGEKVELPAVLWISAKYDDVHNYSAPDSDFPGDESERFAARYQAAGGKIELEVYEAEKLFTVMHPTLPAAVAAMQKLVDFAHEHLSR